jgi:hypothetical protein
MKKLIILLVLFLATTAFGSPYLVTDPQANTDSYVITGGITASPTAQPDGSLRYDLASLPVGSYDIQIAACVGVWCSPTTPFTFERPLVNAPVNVRLVK